MVVAIFNFFCLLLFVRVDRWAAGVGTVAVAIVVSASSLLFVAEGGEGGGGRDRSGER